MKSPQYSYTQTFVGMSSPFFGLGLAWLSNMLTSQWSSSAPRHLTPCNPFSNAMRPLLGVLVGLLAKFQIGAQHPSDLLCVPFHYLLSYVCSVPQQHPSHIFCVPFLYLLSYILAYIVRCNL